MMDSITQPTDEEMQLSKALQQEIKAEIVANGGAISFARFMQMALYTPGLGYYSNGKLKFGKYGDFTTAPEISTLFGYTLANQCAEILAHLKTGCIVEFGAGSGKLALDILTRLQELQSLPNFYYIVEVSAELKQRQQECLQRALPEFYEKIIWLERLPTKPLDAIVIANEVLDAMPVEKFIKTENGVAQVTVALKDDNFIYQQQLTNHDLEKAVRNLEVDFANDYVSEINLMLQAWLNSIYDFLNTGVVLLIDYGYARSEYYHPQRSTGTVQCFYRHQVNDNVFAHIGLQDITAHVDFTAVAESAVVVGYDILGYTSQAMFLLNNELLQFVLGDDVQVFNYNQQVKQLTLPNEMGEKFKVIALGKHYDENVKGFMMQDRLHQL